MKIQINVLKHVTTINLILIQLIQMLNMMWKQIVALLVLIVVQVGPHVHLLHNKMAMDLVFKQ